MGRNKWHIIVLVLILTLGGLIRCWGVPSGLPDLFVHDEIYEVKRALQLLRGEYNFFRSGKGFFFYILSFIYAIYAFCMMALGRFDSLTEFVSFSLAHPGQMVFLSRATNAVVGTFSIYLIYLLGCRIWSKTFWNPALLLAFAWATCWLAAWLANWGFVETCLVTLGILAFFPMLNIASGGSHKDYVLSGALIAAATATKLYGAGLLLPLWLAHFFAGPQVPIRNILLRIFDRKLYVAMVVFVAMWWALDPSFVVLLLFNTGLVDQSKFLFEIRDFAPETHLMFYLTIIRWNIGNFLIPFLCIGLIAAAWKKKNDILICAGFSAIFTIIIGLHKIYSAYDRYVLLVLPSFLIVAVHGIVVIFDLLYRKIEEKINIRLYWPVVLAGIVMIGWNGLESLLRNDLYRKSFVPVAAEAKAWFEQNIPPQSRIIMKGEQVWPGHQTVPLFDLKENYLKKYHEAVRTGRIFIDMEVLPDLALAEGVIRYDLTVVDRDNAWESLDTYIDRGIEYFVIHVQQFQESVTESLPQTGKASRVLIYKALQNSSQVTLVKRFEGMTPQGGEQTIEVYTVIKKGIAETTRNTLTIAR